MEYLALLGGLQMPELVIILIVVLLIFGPKALPKLARSLGSSIREFKDATNKMTQDIMSEDPDQEGSSSVRQRRVEARSNKPVVATEAEAEKVSSPPRTT